jgi:hypothetical protein
MTNPSDKVPQPHFVDIATVESQRNDLSLEEFPEGPVGAASSLGRIMKSSHRRKEQRTSHRFGYENHNLHKNLPRNYPGDDSSVL